MSVGSWGTKNGRRASLGRRELHLNMAAKDNVEGERNIQTKGDIHADRTTVRPSQHTYISQFVINY